MTTMRELRDFLSDAELDHYYSALKNELKVASIPQLKYVVEDDLAGIGMTKPEMRRLKKFYKKEIPQGKLEKFKRAFLMKSSPESSSRPLSPSSADHRISRPISYIRPTGKQIISSDSIEVNRTLGEGEFGVVQQGLWQTEDGEKVEVAIKCLSRDRLENGTQEFLKEAGLMQTIDHENIVRMYGVVLDKDNSLMLVTELAVMRSLLECLKDTTLRSDFPLPRLCDFAQQICDGMSYLESKRLIHRDLAARNILVFNKALVKISDFGLSRALGRGKDYYQSNFSINLKLPIAWCAPECINYLKFTSASDVWGYAVTLWELFTYGVQPWAGMSGQKILDAIDSPNCRRLEMPDLCPKQYYDLMQHCWDQEPDARPMFNEILTRLPQMRPTQVKAVKDFPEITVPKDYIYYQAYDIIIVIDKSPFNTPSKGLWRGVTAAGKCGYFDPYNMVPFVEKVTLPTSPASKKTSLISRKDSKRNACKRISTDMISGPQNDLRHTGHIGYDGAIFGDVGFIGDNYDKLPVKVGSQGKLDDSKYSINLSHISDSPEAGRRLPHSLTDSPLHETPHTSNGYGRSWISVESLESSHMMRTDEQDDHTDTGYQDIDDDSLLSDFKMPDLSSSFDFGGSFMDEVLKALNEKEAQLESPTDKASSTGSRDDQFASNFDRSHSISPPKDVRSPPPALPSQPPRAAPRPSMSQKESRKDHKLESRKQAKVKPMSASDEKMIDDAINMANEFAAQSRAQLLRQESLSSATSDKAQSDSDSDSDSPRLISKLKASIKGRSPKQDRKRTFSDSLNFERESNEVVPAEAQEAYNMLVVHGAMKDGSRPYPRQVVSDLTANRESISSNGSVGHNFAYADSSSSVSRTPDRTSPLKSLSRSSSERVSVSPPNLSRIETAGDRHSHSKPVPLPRPETSLKRTEIPVPRPRPEIQRVEPTPRPSPPAHPELISSTASLIEDTSNNAFDNPLLIDENDWQCSQESLKSDRNSQVEILRVDLRDEKDTASKSSLSLDSGGKSTPSSESNDSKTKFFADDFAEPSPREIMSKLARESRLRRSVDHQRGITSDSETAANKNLREPQGIPGKLPVSPGDETEVDTNPLRMLRGGLIPVRGGRAASGIPSTTKPTLRHPKLHFNTSHTLQHSLSVDAGSDHVNVESDDGLQLEPGVPDEWSRAGAPALPPRSFSVCDSINPLPLPPRAPRRPGSLNQKPRQRMFPLVADSDSSGASSVGTATAHNSGGDLSVSPGNVVENVTPIKHLPALDRISACNPLHDADSSSYTDLPLAPPPPVHQETMSVNENELDDNVFEKSESPRLSKHLNLNLSSEGGTSGASTFPRGLKLFGLKWIQCNLEQLGFYNHQDPFWVKSVFKGDVRCRSDRSPSTDAEASPLMLANYKQRSDGVSYEDLLDFAIDREENGEEVDTMQKFLGNEVSSDDCLAALRDTNGDVLKAIKYIKLRQLLSIELGDVRHCKAALLACDWNVQAAADYLLGTSPPSPECVDV